MIRWIDHVALQVTDLERSIEFYQQFFGFHLYARHKPAGNDQINEIVHLQLDNHETVLELLEAPTGAGLTGGHFSLQIEDFNQEWNRLQQLGIKVISAPRSSQPRGDDEQGWLRAVVAGPDGEEIELRGL